MENTQQQLSLPGIDFVPSRVRQHGLQEFHTYPLVSPGKDETGVWGGSWRVPASQAWQYPEVGLGRTGNSIPALLFDLDGPDAWERLDDLNPDLPVPNWLVLRRSNGHGHAVFTLQKPVLRGERATMTPQRWLARVGEYLALKLKADAAFNGVMSHNPVFNGDLFKTDWRRREPYSLEELGEFVPRGWRQPVGQPMTVYGRNDLLFKAGMSWSGKPSNWGKWSALETHLWSVNAGFTEPLSARELAGIAKSVIRYQRRNLESGKQRQGFLFIQACRGKKSGESRRLGTLLEYDRTPWKTQGVSRATWYRRKMKNRVLIRETEPKQDERPLEASQQ